MAIEVLPAKLGETWEDGQQRQSGSVPYTVKGTTDRTEAEQALLGAAPEFEVMANGNRILRNQISLKLVAVGGDPVGIWDCTVGYDQQDLDDEQDAFSVDFDVGGGTQRITHSITNVARYPSSAPDHKGAIGVTKDGIEGAEIVIPSLSFNFRKKLPDTIVTENYIAGLVNYVGHTNDTTFRSFAAGTLLLLGVSGSRSGQGLWDLNFRIAASPNRTGLSIGSITGIAKKGWEYLWVQYEDEESGNQLVKTPKAVYVEKVYYSAEFSELRI